MNRLFMSAAMLAVTANAASSQLNQRPLTKISDYATPVYAPSYWYGWDVFTPRGTPTSSNTGAGLVASNQLAYVLYMDRDASSVPVFEFRRSLDGGFSWQAPTQMMKLGTGMTWRSEESGGVAEGSTAFAFTTVYNTANGKAQILLWGSENQGRTWIGPINVSPSMASDTMFYVLGQRREQFRNNVKAAMGKGVIHLLYEGSKTWQGSTKPRRGDLYYTALRIQNGALTVVNPEIRVNRNSSIGTVDIDFPDIAVDGSFVFLAWLDDRAMPGKGVWNNCYSTLSTNGGANIGKSTPEYNHTKLAKAMFTSPLPPRVSLSIPNAYVTMEDARVGTTDSIYLDYSSALGLAFSSVLIANNPVSRGGIDSHYIASEGNRVVIAYHDASGARAVVDDNAGRGIKAGTAMPKTISNSSITSLFKVDLRGKTAAVFYEYNGTGGESAAVAYTTDAGITWAQANVDDRSGDVDENTGAITGNGDIIDCHIWSNTGNGANQTVVTGFKVPNLENRFKSSGVGFQLTGLDPVYAGKVGILMFSGTVGNGISFGNMGFSLNIKADAIYGAYLAVLGSSPLQFLAVVDNRGRASWLGIPDYATLLGLDLATVGVVLDQTLSPTNPAYFIGFSDPVK